MIQMIITDLDGTLLRSDKQVSSRTIAVLKKCRSMGIKIAFASARSLQAAQRVFEQFQPDIYAGYGGALVMAGEKVIRRFDISAEVSSRLIRDCLAAPEVSCIFAINESAALTTSTAYLTDSDSWHYQYTDCLPDYQHAYLKIAINSTSQATVERIAARYPMCGMLRYSNEDLYQFSARDAGKWNAALAIAEYYHINTDAFVAFGDDVNDLEMLAKCGVGVAMQNAVEGVKNAADHICGSNDSDGVASWLAEHIIKDA